MEASGVSTVRQAEAQHQAPGWKRFLAHVGPGFLVSLAYLDPGNLETDLQAGASHRYELLWVILVGLIFALIIQSLAANLGVTTGRHLAELCKAEYPVFVKYCLWLLAELAVIAADIPEVIGTAFALNILFNVPVWAGVLVTGLSTLLLLGLQRFGVRKLELLISFLVFLMAACYFGELSYVKPPATEVIKGLFIPKLKGNGATGDAISLLGALVMPHNLFLHSALVLSRKTPPSVKGINDACKYFLLESGFALFVALLINIAVVAVSGTVCAATNLSAEDADRCSDLTLNSASFLLKVWFSVTLFASSTRTCRGKSHRRYVFFVECAGEVELHRVWNLFVGFWPELCDHRHVCWSIYHAGIFGHQNEDMGPKPHDSMHRHLSQSRRGDHRRKGRRRETHHHRIDDPLVRAPLRPHPSAQVQRQQYQDGTSQELRLHNRGVLDPWAGHHRHQHLLLEHELRDVDHPQQPPQACHSADWDRRLPCHGGLRARLDLLDV